MDNNVIGYTIAAVVVATALGNMFNIPKRLQGLSRLKFYAESDNVKSTFDFGLFNKKPPISRTEPISDTQQQTHFAHAVHGPANVPRGILQHQLPYPIGPLLKSLEIQPTDPYVPSSAILKSAYRKCALKTHPDTTGSCAGELFRDVTLDYKRILGAIEEIEHNNSHSKE